VANWYAAENSQFTTDSPQRNATVITPPWPSVSESVLWVILRVTVFCILALPVSHSGLPLRRLTDLTNYSRTSRRRCELWCSHRGGWWWRSRPTNRLDMQTEQTASLSGTWLATRYLLSREMKLCHLVNRTFTTHTPSHLIPWWAAMPATLPPSHHQWNRSVAVSQPQRLWGRERESGV